MFEHDASCGYAEALRLSQTVPDIITANPPWGWRVKATNKHAGNIAETGTDCARSIIINLLGEFSTAIVLLACPELPPTEEISGLGFEICQNCPLGQSAIWVLAPKTGVNQRYGCQADHANG